MLSGRCPTASHRPPRRVHLERRGAPAGTARPAAVRARARAGASPGRASPRRLPAGAGPLQRSRPRARDRGADRPAPGAATTRAGGRSTSASGAAGPPPRSTPRPSGSRTGAAARVRRPTASRGLRSRARRRRRRRAGRAGGPWLVVSHGGCVRAVVAHVTGADHLRLGSPPNASADDVRARRAAAAALLRIAARRRAADGALLMLDARVRTAHADAWAVEGVLREPYGGAVATLRGIRVMASGLAHPQWNGADVTGPYSDLEGARRSTPSAMSMGRAGAGGATVEGRAPPAHDAADGAARRRAAACADVAGSRSARPGPRPRDRPVRRHIRVRLRPVTSTARGRRLT